MTSLKRHQLTEVRKKEKASDGNMKGTKVRLKGKCPFGELQVGGRWTKCLIYTAAKVSCISDKCYQLHYTGMKELNEELRLTSVDGSGVEYVGYVELELEVDGWICLAGFLVLKGDVKPAVVLGSNVFRQWA